ncbi:MAG: sortase [Candidatus Dojkabacteria bacterium]|jgi:LPXTG-site transpeptidase (sortase) family protein|nr:sortase [Candidatus Dojkabacteria bacterium]
MKFLKLILKFGVVFILVFATYTFLYQYQVSSSPQVELEKTFIPSDKEISKTANENGDKYREVPDTPVVSSGLTEENIDKNGFYIRIDRINLFKPAVKNVDPRYKDVYTQSWEIGVSHGKFTALPDQIGNVYFFAHAVSDASRMEAENAWGTRFDELTENDEIILYYEGKKYTYQVSRIYTVSPTATGVYTGVSPVAKVTLQTCGPPRGSLASRYMVEALQVSVSDF